METFGILGFVFGLMGLMGFFLAIVAIARITNLIKKLKEFDVIPENFETTNGLKKKNDYDT